MLIIKYVSILNHFISSCNKYAIIACKLKKLFLYTMGLLDYGNISTYFYTYLHIFASQLP